MQRSVPAGGYSVLTAEALEALRALGVVLRPHEAADDEVHLGGDQQEQQQQLDLSAADTTELALGRQRPVQG